MKQSIWNLVVTGNKYMIDRLRTIRHLLIFLHVFASHRPLKSIALSLATIVVVSALLSDPARGDTNYDVFMYKNKDVQDHTVQFSPKDEIVVRIRLEDLPKGVYTFHADWYNAAGELQDASAYRFTTTQTADRGLESHLEIRKASPLKKLFSASEATGYHIKFYGKWQVKLYLNGEEIACTEFEVQ